MYSSKAVGRSMVLLDSVNKHLSHVCVGVDAHSCCGFVLIERTESLFRKRSDTHLHHLKLLATDTQRVDHA